MAAAACARFSQNAWRREMCANCFKAKTEHAAPPPRPPAPPAHAVPQHSILKGVGKRPEKKAQKSGVCFPKEEAEIIGYDGGDVSTDDEDNFEASNSDLPDSSFPELSDAEDKELQNLTRKNTDFNSENVNLLSVASVPPATNGISVGNKITVNITNSVTTNGKPKTEPLELGKVVHKSTVPIVSVTPFGSKPTAICAPTPKERSLDKIEKKERRPPLGHEDTSPPLTAPALVKTIKEISLPKEKEPEPAVVKIEVPSKPVEEVGLSLTPSDSDASTVSEDETKKPPAFLHHKDSVDLISPPTSPLLLVKNDERPVPIGKVSSDLSIALKNNALNKKPEFERRKKNGTKLSAAPIRRWTVSSERVFIQPRRPIMDAPEIVPLTLHSYKPLEPRELAGEPDGEDSKVTEVDNQPEPKEKEEVVEVPMEKVEEPKVEEVPQPAEEKTELVVEEEIDSSKPPTPPSSPLPDDDLPPMLPNTPPPVLQIKTPPARPTSLPTVVTSGNITPNARSSFLHSNMLGRPQVPAKPASLMLANVSSSGRRHPTTPVAVAVPTPVTPVKIEETQKTILTPALETPPPKPVEPEFFETPKTILFSPEGKPPILTPRPKLGSYKKRQAPKPPGNKKDDDYSRSPPSEESSFDELHRRDSITSVDKSSLQAKKNVGRFSLKRIFRKGSKEERATLPESIPSPTSTPSSPESPLRPEIIHPSNLDGRQVEVVCRVEQSATTPTTPTPQSETSMLTPPARPRPPPPPRTMSLPQNAASRPARPPPPQSAQLLQMRERDSDQNEFKQEDSIYANLDSVKNRIGAVSTPNKPQRSGSIREQFDKTSPGSPGAEEGEYETVQFSDGKTLKRRRSVILGSLEENYGAVVGANHRALAQLLSVLTSKPLPSEMSSVSVACYAGECRNVDEKTLVVMQILMELKNMQQAGATAANLDQFRIARPKDPNLAVIGPRVECQKEVAPNGSLPSVATRACQLLAPTDITLTPLLDASDFDRAVTYLELKTWGPEVSPVEREVGLQRWLDLERATTLQSLAQNRSANRLPVAQEMFASFLVEASAVSLAQAAKLL
ncbi:titin [Neocloeon triangulifer]|uniref:titin n=1 Tax=Neocloeon triangulifer TaxID=2078957 RepID=UPI00286F529B|nr:titin [Neocloeon triangulifer]